MCTRATLAEVRELQKAAGIINENDIDYSLDEMLDDEGMMNEKTPIPGCGPMWDGHKAVEGVRWMFEGDPGRHSTCLLPGKQPDFKVSHEGRLYSLVPYTNQESVQEAVGPTSLCGPTFTAISTGPKPTDYACFPTNGLPQKLNGKPLQKKVGSPTTPAAAPVAPTPQMQA